MRQGKQIGWYGRVTRYFGSSAMGLGLLLALMGPSVGCSRLLGALEEEVEDRVADDVRRRAGQGEFVEDPEDPPVDTTIEINSVQPSRGETGGWDPINIVGFGFEPDMKVFFGSIEADPAFVEINDTGTGIHVVTPPQAMARWVAIQIVNDEHEALLENAYEYYDPVTIESVSPSRGPVAGDVVVAVQGTGFIDGTTVQFGTLPAISTNPIDSTSLTVLTRSMPRGTYAVTVTNNNGTSTLAQAYTTVEPVRLHSVTPAAGPLSGGTMLNVVGTGLAADSTFTLGGRTLDVTASADERNLTGLSQSPTPAVEGLVSAQVHNGFGSHQRSHFFTFYDAADTTPRVISVSPSTAIIDGGREITVVVGGTDNVNTTVFFGTTEATCSKQGSVVLTCAAPAHAEGPAPLRVFDGAEALPESAACTASGCSTFTYVDLRFEAAVPNRAAIAGNTYVQLSGNGFAADTEVFFGDLPARDVVVMGGQALTLRTPRTDVDVSIADLRINTQGVSLTVDDAFTFFDPVNMDFWASGDPVDGAVNVTVFDDATQRVTDAFVILGGAVDPSRPYLSGFTDNRGQITLSGPGLTGVQSVHAGKSGFGNFSWVDMGVENLTVRLTDLPPAPPDPLPDCPDGGGGGAPPIIRGDVFRIKDQYNTGNDYVLVTTTHAGFGTFLPDPGPGAQMINQGAYDIFARTGELAIIAIAGNITVDGTLDAHAIGIRPFLTTQSSSADPCATDGDCLNTEETCEMFEDQGYCMMVYNDIDVVIDIPLNQPMAIDLDDPPFGASTIEYPAAPANTIIDVVYEFGQMGIFAMQDYPLGPYGMEGVPVPDALFLPSTEHVFYDMPQSIPSSVGSVTFSVSGQATGQDPFYGDLTWSETYVEGLSSTQQPVLLTPMLQVPYENRRMRLRNPFSTAPHVVDFDTIPGDDGSVTGPTGYVHYLYDVKELGVCVGPFGVVTQPFTFIYWWAMSPGSTTSFELPRFPAAMSEANLPQGMEDRLIWQVTGNYSPGANFRLLSVDALFDWKSRSLRLAAF